MLEQQPTQELFFLLECAPESPGQCSGGSSTGIVFLSTRFRIEDNVLPTLVTTPSGALLGGGQALTGTQSVGLEAVDKGGGIFRAVLQVDGAAVAERVFDGDSPNCRPPFRTVVPCAAKVAGTLDLDTTRLADGPHEAVLSVYDATNDNRVVYGPVTFSTANETVASYCGETSPRRIRLSAPRRSLRYGRGFRIRARILGAAGWEAVLLDGQKRVRPVARSTVSARGSVTLRIPPGPNRALRLAVRPVNSRTKFICSTVRAVRVRAGVSLSATPRSIANGRSVLIHGRLRGLSHGRRSVVVQARAVGSSRWATVRVVRTSRDGEYRMKYRFRRTFTTVVYLFRSQVRAEKAYPYATGTSRVTRVRVAG